MVVVRLEMAGLPARLRECRCVEDMMSEPSRRLLRTVEIDNFRCIRHAVVELSPFTVLIGSNDSGKTAFLKTIEALARLAAGQPLIEAFPSLAGTHIAADALRSPTPAPEMRFATVTEGEWGTSRHELSIASGSATDSVWIRREAIGPGGGSLSLAAPGVLAAVEVSGAEASGPIESARFIDGKQLDVAGGKQRLTISQWGPPDHPSRRALAALREVVTDPAGAGRFAPLVLRLSPDAVIRPSDPTALPARIGQDGNGLAGVVARIKQGPSEVFRRLLDDFRELTHGAVTDILPLPAPGERFHTLRLRFRNGAEVPAEHVSTGVLYLLAVLTLVHGPSRPWLLFVEEPENSVHVGRLRDIVTLLRRLGETTEGRTACQVVITTHSPYLLDACKPAEVRVFRRPSPEDWTLIDVPPQDEDKRWWGMSLGELWGFSGEDALLAGPRSPRGVEREIVT
ncbi:MAG: ATP-binding protein [Deltaproteobacteria bacterium]|nr:ATP-binding protein [Deltaproteobacteria bacterium]